MYIFFDWNPTKEETAKFPCRFFDKVLKICRIQNLKSLFLRLSFCVKIILVSGFFVAQADSIYHCFGSGIWARHEPEAKHSGQRLIPKPRGFFLSLVSQKYIPVVIVITLQRIITLQRKTCVNSYILPRNSLSYKSLPPSRFRKISAVLGRLKCPEFLAMVSRFDLLLSPLPFCYCKKQVDVSFPCVCPVIDNEFRHNIVKVVRATLTMLFNGAKTNCGIAHILGILLMNSCNTVIFLATTIICSLSTFNYDEIHAQQQDRRMKSWRQFVK